MSIHNIGFHEDLTKIIFQLSSNMHQLSLLLVLLSYEATGMSLSAADIPRRNQKASIIIIPFTEA